MMDGSKFSGEILKYRQKMHDISHETGCEMEQQIFIKLRYAYFFQASLDNAFACPLCQAGQRLI